MRPRCLGSAHLRCGSKLHVQAIKCPRPVSRTKVLKRTLIARAESGASTEHNESDASGKHETNNWELPGFLKPLTDFGVGKKSVWEGGVGLFVLVGAGVTGAIIAWISGLNVRKTSGYECTVLFPEACAITVGTPVRLRGIKVGSVLNVQPHLDRVDVLLEITDENTVIPRNSRIFANQSGLIAEPLVDILPQHPIPSYTASPLAADCRSEGSIVCNRTSIQGEKGVSLDDLVFTCTKLMRQMDADGMDAMITAADTLCQAVSDTKPLVDATTKLIDQVHPLLAELREKGLVEHVDALATIARETATDIRKLQTSVLDEENVQELKRSIKTLTATLRNIESLTGDIAGLSADSGAHASLRQLIEAFSRLVAD